MEGKNSLHILWTNADMDTSMRMVMMYATNSMIEHWWDDIMVIIWGATARLVAENDQIQEAIKVAMNVGVKFSACIACARQLGVIEKLESQGIEVKAWGRPLTDLLQSNDKLLTI
jgi:hypothetical protein